MGCVRGELENVERSNGSASLYIWLPWLLLDYAAA